MGVTRRARGGRRAGAERSGGRLARWVLSGDGGFDDRHHPKEPTHDDDVAVDRERQAVGRVGAWGGSARIRAGGGERRAARATAWRSTPSGNGPCGRLWPRAATGRSEKVRCFWRCHAANGGKPSPAARSANCFTATRGKPDCRSGSPRTARGRPSSPRLWTGSARWKPCKPARDRKLYHALLGVSAENGKNQMPQWLCR